MLAAKITQLVMALIAGGPAVTMEKGKLQVANGRKAVGVYLKCSIPIANATGGAVTLSDTQKQTLLSCIQATIDLRADEVIEEIFTAQGFDRLHRSARRFYASEIEGYTDSVTGMAQSLPNGATTTVIFYMPIPTGRAWFLEDRFKDIWGMGSFQSRQLQISLRCTSVAIATNLTLANTPNATFDVIPDVVAAKRETWSPMFKFTTKAETDKTLNLSEGLHAAIVETTHNQAAAVFTNNTLKIGDELIYDQLSSAESIITQNDASIQPSAGITTDRETLCYEATDGERKLEQMPVGAPQLVQNSHDLATFNAGHEFMPILSEHSLDVALLNVAKMAGKKVKAINAAVADGIPVPHRLLPFMPMYLVFEDDALYEQFAGRVALPGELATTIETPPQVKAAAKALHDHHAAGGRPLSAANVVKQFASSVPGVVQSAAGFDKNVSASFSTLRAQLH